MMTVGLGPKAEGPFSGFLGQINPSGLELFAVKTAVEGLAGYTADEAHM